MSEPLDIDAAIQRFEEKLQSEQQAARDALLHGDKTGSSQSVARDWRVCPFCGKATGYQSPWRRQCIACNISIFCTGKIQPLSMPSQSSSEEDFDRAESAFNSDPMVEQVMDELDHENRTETGLDSN